MLYLFRVRRAQQMVPVAPYGEVPQHVGAAGFTPPDVYISGPYQSPLPGVQQPTSGPTQTYPVADLQAGYSPYIDPGAGAGTFPPQDPGYAAYPAGANIYGAQDGNGIYSPGTGHAQMPYQEGNGYAGFHPPQEGSGDQYYPPYQGG